MAGQFVFKYSVIWESIPILLQGVKLTIWITIFGLLIGFCQKHQEGNCPSALPGCISKAFGEHR